MIIPNVTYKGVRPIISINTAMLITDIALKNANFIMLRKILDALTIVTTILVLGILGGGFFTFKYVTSEQFKAKIMNEIMGNVSGLMPKVLDKGLPKTTGISIPKL